jgi:hypothetical protein
MDAIQSEKAADGSPKGAFLIDPARIRSRTAASPKATSSSPPTEQSRDGSPLPDTRTQQSQAQLLNESGRFCSKLNRQTPELETALNLRKQRTVNRSNRQKFQFFNSRSSRSTSSSPCSEQLSQGLAHSVFLEGSQPISNRELLVLEIPQHAENKHRRPVLIENFELNHRLAFRAFVAAAFRRAAFACQNPSQARESARARGCR